MLGNVTIQINKKNNSQLLTPEGEPLNNVPLVMMSGLPLSLGQQVPKVSLPPETVPNSRIEMRKQTETDDRLASSQKASGYATHKGNHSRRTSGHLQSYYSKHQHRGGSDLNVQ